MELSFSPFPYLNFSALPARYSRLPPTRPSAPAWQLFWLTFRNGKRGESLLVSRGNKLFIAFFHPSSDGRRKSSHLLKSNEDHSGAGSARILSGISISTRTACRTSKLYTPAHVRKHTGLVISRFAESFSLHELPNGVCWNSDPICRHGTHRTSHQWPQSFLKLKIRWRISFITVVVGIKRWLRSNFEHILNDEDCEQRLEEILESSDECKGEEKSFEEVTEDVQSYQKLPVIGFSEKFLHPIYALLGERQCNVNDQIMFFVNLLMNEVVE